MITIIMVIELICLSQSLSAANAITFDAHLETEARFSKVPKLYGRISGDMILLVFMKRRGLVVRNSAVILIFIPFTTYD